MGVREVERRLRERKLASDGRAGEGVRGRVRADLLSHLRRGWRHYLAVALIGMLLVGGLSTLVPDERLQGVLLGGGLTWWFAAMLFVLVQVSGAAPRLMGADGEMWTATEVRRLRRQGWSVVNDVYLSGGNIDHVLVGPGGVIAAESKWSARSWSSSASDSAVRDAVRQAQQQARRLRLWHELKSLGIAHVRPVVVLWGAGTTGEHARDVHTVVDGVEVLVGHELRAWLQRLPGSALTPEDAAATRNVLAERCRRRDEYVRGNHPLPRSLHAAAVEALLIFSAFMAGFVGGCQVAVDITDGHRWTAGAAVLGAGWLVGWLFPRARRPLAWAGAGVVTAALLVGALVAIAMFVP